MASDAPSFERFRKLGCYWSCASNNIFLATVEEMSFLVVTYSHMDLIVSVRS
jgi:hypothetical protein